MAEGDRNTRVLLEGDTLHIGFHGTGKAPYPEDIVIPAIFRAISQHRGIDLHTEGIFWGDYCFFAGITGEAFRFLEFMNLGRVHGDGPLYSSYGNDPFPAPFRRAFDAAGLESAWYRRPLPDREEVKRMIVESLRDRNTPVIGFGVFPAPEPFLITGYDEGGEVLLGWSHLQGEKHGLPEGDVAFEPSGQFRLRRWYESIDGIGIAGEPKAFPDRRSMMIEALRIATGEVGTDDEALGTGAMERWARHLEADRDFAGLSDEGWKKAHSDHSTTAGDLAERRALAAHFLELCIRALPEVSDELGAARAAFQSMHETVYEIWETVARGGPFDPDIAQFRDPEKRRLLAGLVRRLAVADRCALDRIGQALRTLDGDRASSVGEDRCLDRSITGNFSLRPAKNREPAGDFLWAPENIHIANSMSMLGIFLGESFGDLNEAEKANRKLDYVLWMGFTGAAFGTIHDTAIRSNLELAFDVLGYDYELWLDNRLAGESGLACRRWGWDDNLRRRIIWNLRDRGLPVLLHNCGPWPDWWLVTAVEHWHSLKGYGGSSGEGYRPNEPFDHPKNPLREIHLFEGMRGRNTWTLMVTAKRRGERPPLEASYLRAVTFGAAKMRSPEMPLLDGDGKEFVSAHPFEDWATMIEDDRLFPDDPQTLRTRRSWLEGHEVELAERRHYGAAFLDFAAIRLGDERLEVAAGHFRKVNSLVEEIWAISGGLGNADAFRAYGDRSARAEIAGIVRRIAEEESRACALLVASDEAGRS